MDRKDDDWKQQALADFGQWLDEWAEDSLEADGEEPVECDLRDLFAEMAALRQETRLQNREQAKAGRELEKATALYETVADWAQHREEDLASFEQRVARDAEDRCLRPFLAVRDALVRGQAAAVELHKPPRLFRRPVPGIAGVVQGYELALSRFDRTLAQCGVQLLQTVGHPFDARTMRAVETRRVAQRADNVVVEEFLSGFTRDGQVLRLAEVAVNRLDIQE